MSAVFSDKHIQSKSLGVCRRLAQNSAPTTTIALHQSQSKLASTLGNKYSTRYTVLPLRTKRTCCSLALPHQLCQICLIRNLRPSAASFHQFLKPHKRSLLPSSTVPSQSEPSEPSKGSTPQPSSLTVTSQFEPSEPSISSEAVTYQLPSLTVPSQFEPFEPSISSEVSCLLQPRRIVLTDDFAKI